MEEEVGFEPTVGYQPTSVFKTDAIIHLGHSSTSCSLYMSHAFCIAMYVAQPVCASPLWEAWCFSLWMFYSERSRRSFHQSTRPFGPFLSGAAVSFRIPLPHLLAMLGPSSSEWQSSSSILFVNYKVYFLVPSWWVTKNPPGLCAPEGCDLGDHLNPLYLVDPPSFMLSNTQTLAGLGFDSPRCVSACVI